MQEVNFKPLRSRLNCNLYEEIYSQQSRNPGYFPVPNPDSSFRRLSEQDQLLTWERYRGKYWIFTLFKITTVMVI